MLGIVITSNDNAANEHIGNKISYRIGLDVKHLRIRISHQKHSSEAVL